MLLKDLRSFDEQISFSLMLAKLSSEDIEMRLKTLLRFFAVLLDQFAETGAPFQKVLKGSCVTKKESMNSDWSPRTVDRGGKQPRRTLGRSWSSAWLVQTYLSHSWVEQLGRPSQVPTLMNLVACTAVLQGISVEESIHHRTRAGKASTATCKVYDTGNECEIRIVDRRVENGRQLIT